MKNFPPNLAFRPPLSRCCLRGDLCAVIVIALGILLLGSPWLRSQTTVKTAAKPGSKLAAPSAAGKIAAIKSIRVLQEKNGPTVEIISTKPLVPSVRALAGPDRLVIDLPNARLLAQQKPISVKTGQIGAIRADQLQQNPPLVRIVVDLLAPRIYNWDATGNRILVHLGKNPNPTAASSSEPPTVSSLTRAPQPVVTEVRAAGPLTLTENGGAAGSAITAGHDTAVLRLSSGGEMRVCPGTTVSVTPSKNRHNLMLGMNAGALEAHFALDASSDSVMTPDFRILLVGPGEFHYAISADNRGNTCVRALSGNTASVIVTELLGDRTYQVKATDQLVFRSGQLDRVDRAVSLECGCPPPREAPLRAADHLPTESPMPSATPAQAMPPVNPLPVPVAEAIHMENASSTAAPAAGNPLDASLAPNDLHVQITAPLVFHATVPPPAPLDDVRALPLDSRRNIALALETPLPPLANENPEPAGATTASQNHAPVRRFFRKLGGFFAAMLR